MQIFNYVLLVSQSFGFRQVVKHSFVGDNIVIVNCSKCEDALEELDSNTPVLVIIDLDMNDKLLQELVLRAQEHTRTPLVLVAENSAQFSYMPSPGETIKFCLADPQLLNQLHRSVDLAIELSGRYAVKSAGFRQVEYVAKIATDF